MEQAGQERTGAVLFHFPELLRVVKSIETERGTLVAGRRMESYCFMVRVSVLHSKHTSGGWLHGTVNVLSTTELYP